MIDKKEPSNNIEELKKFFDEYIKAHRYISSKTLATSYLLLCGSNRKEIFNKKKKLIYRFSRIIGIAHKSGLVEKYNSNQYRRIKK